MAYTKTLWEGKPSTATPINKARLDKIEQGISDAHDHMAAATGAHAGSSISFSPTGLAVITGTATTVQAALAQLDTAVSNRALSSHTHPNGAHPDLAAHDTLGLATQAELDAHAATATAAHAASGVSVSTSGLVVVTTTNVQSAIAQLDTRIARDQIDAAAYGMSPSATAAVNTAALLQAVDVASANFIAGTGPRKVQLPLGVCKIRKSAEPAAGYSWRTPRGVEVAGYGEGLSVLQVEAVNLSTDSYQSVVAMKGTAGNLLKDVYLHDFTIDGNRGAMTGTPTANSMDAIDMQYCDQSVRVERVTVINGTADGFDVDDSTANVVRNCAAINCNGYGFHASENSSATVFFGCYAESCGTALTRGGFDQHTTASGTVYLGCVGVSNYRNFDINGSGAITSGCRSFTGANADTLTGVAFGTEPASDKVIVGGAAGGIRFIDTAALTDTNRRWLVSLANNVLSWFSTTFGANVMNLTTGGNLGLRTTSFGGGSGVLGLANAVTVPNVNPTAGGALYVEAGQLKYRGSDGTQQTLAPSTPDITAHLNVAHNRLFDSFTRADNATSMGRAETRYQNWADMTGGGVWGIIGNQAYKPSAGYGIIGLEAERDGVLQVTIAAFNTGDEFWLIARMNTGAADYFRFGKRGANTTYTFEDQTGNATVLPLISGRSFPTAQVGDILRVITRRNDGVAVEIERGGVTTRYIESGTTQSFSASNTKIGLAAVGGGGVRFDNLEWYEL